MNDNSVVRGDDKAMPNQGTGTAVDDNYGASLGPEALNKQGPATGTDSDPASWPKSKEQRI